MLNDLNVTWKIEDGQFVLIFNDGAFEVFGTVEDFKEFHRHLGAALAVATLPPVPGPTDRQKPVTT